MKSLYIFLIICLLFLSVNCRKKKKHYKLVSKANPFKHRVCLKLDQTLKARHKTCFLRPDTGPCRADIIQWYYDVRQSKCYRFFWGGCQGNGNRFESQTDCYKFCALNVTSPPVRIPHFCSLLFDYGNCFGYFNRWAWDSLTKTCRRRLYSGCGGNQNNFQTRDECMSTCLTAPNNTLQRRESLTTCIPIVIPDIHN